MRQVRTVVTVILVWLALSVPVALLASRVLKARREEMEAASKALAESRARLDRQGRQGPPSWDRRARPVKRAPRVSRANPERRERPEK